MYLLVWLLVLSLPRRRGTRTKGHEKQVTECLPQQRIIARKLRGLQRSQVIKNQAASLRPVLGTTPLDIGDPG